MPVAQAGVAPLSRSSATIEKEQRFVTAHKRPPIDGLSLSAWYYICTLLYGVTDFRQLRGWSTSVPLISAT
ncbi:hypothetical protein KCP77_01705 [Salmonella enterica subsp. enterica]|nr:hypothetical protein KCP77_01705 [Salmonella enterica subsp. enterica]